MLDHGANHSERELGFAAKNSDGNRCADLAANQIHNSINIAICKQSVVNPDDHIAGKNTGCLCCRASNGICDSDSVFHFIKSCIYADAAKCAREITDELGKCRRIVVSRVSIADRLGVGNSNSVGLQRFILQLRVGEGDLAVLRQNVVDIVICHGLGQSKNLLGIRISKIVNETIAIGVLDISYFVLVKGGKSPIDKIGRDVGVPLFTSGVNVC